MGARAKPTLPELMAAKGPGQLVMLTAYDAGQARLAQAAGIDLLLVGDSAAMVVFGHASTVPMTLAATELLTAAVRRGAPEAFVVSDLPFGSYQASDEDALTSSIALVRSGADAVKLEGPQLARVRALTAVGIPVLGHLGLTPQTATSQGGYKAQARSAAAARHLLADAQALAEAGVFALVLEAVPPEVAARVTAALPIPTIGIGAGPDCDGQVLVWHDLLGLSEATPRFVKRYAELGALITEALARYAAEVRDGSFPADGHTYPMSDGESSKLDREG